MSNEENLANTFSINQQDLKMDISEAMVKSELSLEELLSYFASNLLEGWCYYGTETKLTFIHTNMLTRKEDICFTLDCNFSVKVSFSQRPEFIVNDVLTSVCDIKNYMKKLQETILCQGTGIYYLSYATKCTGQMPSNSTHSHQTPRCIWCGTLRKRLIMKENANASKTTIKKAREAVEKHKKRYNQLVQKKRILNQELTARENAHISDELLTSVISELPDTKKLSMLAYLDGKLEDKGNHSSELFREQDLSQLANHHQNDHSHSESPDNFVDCKQDIVIKKEDIDEYNEDSHSEIPNNLVDCGSDIDIKEENMFSVDIEEEEGEKEEVGEKKDEEVHSELVERDVFLKEKSLVMPMLEIKPLTSKGVAISVFKRGESESGTGNKYYSIIQLTNEEMCQRIEKLKNEYFFSNALHKCESCVLTFKDENELHTHNNDVHLPKPIHVQCKICSVYVLDHRLYHHKAAHRLLYKCSTCGVVSCVGGMLGHLNEHSVPIFELNKLKKTAMLLNPSLKYDIVKKMNVETEFPCPECDKCFEKAHLKYKHISKCHREGFKCETCGKKFTFRENLNRHRHVHTPYLPREECPICHTMVRSDRVKAHAMIHSDRQQFYCNICDKKFVSKYNYNKHMRNTKLHEVRELPHESTKASTTEVQTITSRKKTNAQRCREYRERKKLQNTMVQNITAERSDDQLPAKRPKTNAERRKKHYEAQKLKKQKSKKIPKTAKQRSKEYYYRKKNIRALNALNHHSDAYACDHCTKVFRFKTTLEDHMNYNHMGRREYKCPICNKELATRRSIPRHVSKAHKGLDTNDGVKVMCQICQRTFTNKKSLQEHELIHAGQKPLSCDICNRSFRQKLKLYAHRRRVHNIPDRDVVVNTGDGDDTDDGGLLVEIS